MISSNTNYLPKGPPPNTTTLRIRVSAYEFGDTDIQSVREPHILNLGPILGHHMVSTHFLSGQDVSKWHLP